MPAENELWTIVPKVGLGQLRFGATPSEVDQLVPTYGASTGRRAVRTPDALLQETLAQFGGMLSEEEKREMLRTLAEHGPDPSLETEVRDDHGFTLMYQSGRLVEIMLLAPHVLTVLGGQTIFSLGARDMLVLAERLNGAPGRYRSTEAAFDALAISLDGFSVTTKSGTVKLLPASDERFRGRSITLRSAPYRPADEMAAFVARSFL